VFSTEELRAIVTQNRVFGGMIYSNAMKDWIASRAHVDAEITVQVDQIKNGRAWVTLQLFAGPNITGADKLSKANVPDTKIAGQLALTEKQVESAGREYHAQMSIPAATAGKDGISLATCVHCPAPEYKHAYGRAGFHGTIYLLATVLPDGTADEILLVRPSGLFLDGLAIDTVLAWRFSPSVDAKKRPVATQVPIEIAFR
jgi:outer membrane biosynthesis protein TonB